MTVDTAGLIAFHHFRGIGWHTLAKLLRLGWSFAEKLNQDVLDVLRECRLDSDSLAQIKRCWSCDYVQEISGNLRRNNTRAITIYDTGYPRYLKEIAQPPWILYIKGDPACLNRPLLAVVGTRQPSTYGLKIARTLSFELAQAGFGIVSGLAYGIDKAAHQGALQAQGITIAVLGSGVDVIYPKGHRQLYLDLICSGAVVSEYPLGTAPHPGLFPQRNRIISGLSLGTLVVEAARRSGSLITAAYSLEQNREVFAIPGPVTSDKSLGTNWLIQQGAKCVTSVEDILEEFRPLIACK
jgi:DNA processing protein